MYSIIDPSKLRLHASSLASKGMDKVGEKNARVMRHSDVFIASLIAIASKNDADPEFLYQ